MNFKEAVESVLLKKFANFDGRACRSEYWYFFLFCFVLGVVAGILDGMIFGTGPEAAGWVGLVLNLALLVPSIAVGARRLHDTGRSGWWMLIMLTIIGIIPLIYWYCQKGTIGDNAFGTDPLAGQA